MSVLMRRICFSRTSIYFSMKEACSPCFAKTKVLGLCPLTHYSSSILSSYRNAHHFTVFRIPKNGFIPSTGQLQLPQARTVVNFSKRRGKKKSVKAVSKRFHRTGSGKLKYWPAGRVHNMLAKSRNHRRRLRKPRYATKTQLKTLNKMISGW